MHQSHNKTHECGGMALVCRGIHRLWLNNAMPMDNVGVPNGKGSDVMNTEQQILDYVCKAYINHYKGTWKNGNKVRSGECNPNNCVFWEQVTDTDTHKGAYVSVSYGFFGWRLNMWDEANNHYYGAFNYDSFADAIAAAVVVTDVLMDVPMDQLFA